MIALRPGSGRPGPGPDGVVMVPAASLGRSASLVRRDTAPDCEAGASPDIPAGCVVVLLRTTPHPESRKLSGMTTGSSAQRSRLGRRAGPHVFDTPPPTPTRPGAPPPPPPPTPP